jgi:glycosyltransferase involved in cell wall biosynthesis
MPLDDSEWTRGKCGFKLLQYMSVGIPAVASPVGVNVDIIESGVSGYLASTEQEWRACLITLCDDVELRKSMGTQARQRVSERYSVNAWCDTFIQCVIGSHAPS